MTGKKNRKRLSQYDLENMKKCRAEALKRRIEAKTAQPKKKPSASPPEAVIKMVALSSIKTKNLSTPKDPAKSKKMKAIWESRMKKRAAQVQRNRTAVQKRCSKLDSSATMSQQ